MSDYHILTQDPKRKTVQVVFHFSVPSTGKNSAGISWQNAAVKGQGGSTNIVSRLPDISTEEEEALKSGAIVERIETVRFSTTNLTNAERKKEIEAAFTKAKAAFVAEIQVVFDWIGYAGDVA